MHLLSQEHRILDLEVPSPPAQKKMADSSTGHEEIVTYRLDRPHFNHRQSLPNIWISGLQNPIHSLFRSEKKKVCGFLCHRRSTWGVLCLSGNAILNQSSSQVCLSRRWAAKRVRSQSGALQHQSKPLWSQGHWEGTSRETVRFLRGYGQQNGK